MEERQRGLYFELQVAPAVNFATLEEVMIVLGDAEGATDAVTVKRSSATEEVPPR